MKPPRLAATLMLLCTAGLAGAQTYPTKPIQFIVPFPPGGGTPQEFSAHIKAELARMGQAIKAAGLKLE